MIKYKYTVEALMSAQPRMGSWSWPLTECKRACVRVEKNGAEGSSDIEESFHGSYKLYYKLLV